jgi:hypothetical protein
MVGNVVLDEMKKAPANKSRVVGYVKQDPGCARKTSTARQSYVTQ